MDYEEKENEKEEIEELKKRLWRKKWFWREKKEDLKEKKIKDYGKINEVEENKIRKKFKEGGKRKEIYVIKRLLKEGVSL